MLQRYRIREDVSNLKDVRKTFNQGSCEVYNANERTLVDKIGRFDYSIESVGISQYYQARINGLRIDLGIGVPYNELIDNQCIVKIKDEWYKIIRLQYKDNRKPNWWLITLQKSEFSYDESELI